MDNATFNLIIVHVSVTAAVFFRQVLLWHVLKRQQQSN